MYNIVEIDTGEILGSIMTKDMHTLKIIAKRLNAVLRKKRTYRS
ncbi:hypothetical protein [Weissella oryzae]|nr:hypothetical protein [Weissella oryzae]